VKARWLLLATLAALVVGMMALASTAWAVPDGIPPEVVGTAPKDGAPDVALDAKIKVKFSEPMKDRSVSFDPIEDTRAPNIYLTKADDPTTIIEATVDYVDEIIPVRAVLKPTVPLEPNTEYTVTVEGAGDGDMKAVKDASGTPLASDYIFSFTTVSGP